MPGQRLDDRDDLCCSINPDIHGCGLIGIWQVLALAGSRILAPSAEKLSQDGIMMCVGGRDGALGLRLCETPWLRSNGKHDGGANVIDGTMRIDVSPRLVLLLRDFNHNGPACK